MFQRIEKYNQQFNSIDLLKFIAVLFMIVDHVGVYFLDNNEFFRTFGRIAAPLFFFLVGYHLSSKSVHGLALSSLRNWLVPPLNLLLFGAILTGLYFLIQGKFLVDILVSIFLIRLYLLYFSPKNESVITILFFTALLIIANHFVRSWIEYGLIGLIYAMGGQLLYLGRRKLASFLFFVAIATQFSYYWPHKDHPAYLVFVGLLVWGMLTFFAFRELKVPARMKNILLVCARYSLEIYFIHLFLLRVYALWKI